MKNLRSVLFFLFFTCLSVALVLAQGECANVVQEGLAATDQNCANLGRNQACYGNVLLEAVPQAWVTDFNFAENGDVVDVAAVESLHLSSEVEDTGVWGVAVMNIQANLPDTLPGQNVTVLLFGQVDLTNAVESEGVPVQVEVAALDDTNVRLSPSTEGTVIESLLPNETIIADGRLDDSSWLRVRLPDVGGVGWVFSELMSTSGDLSTLRVFEPFEPAFEPMQAVYFQSGIGQSTCAEMPESGVLIQTPAGVGEVALRVNEVDISLGSTIYMQAQAGGDMLVTVVEGHANVTASGVSVFAPEGTRVRIPLDNDLHASGAPTGLEPYDNAPLVPLPTSLLPRIISVAISLTWEQINALGVPLAGIWSTVITDSTCQANDFDTDVVITISEDGGTISVDNGTVFQRLVPGVYFVDTPTNRSTMFVISPEQMLVSVVHPDVNCRFSVTATHVGS
jgi:hypothetical protein